jgi:outer membrane biosynthesis protein TonB
MLDRPQAMTRKLPLDVPRNGASAPPVSRPGLIGPGPPGGGRREHHPLPRPPAPPVRRDDEMGAGLMIALVLHTAAVVLMLLGLPDLFKREPPQETSIAVTLVNPAKETRTTTPNPHPKLDAKPVPPPPVPAEKPLPPVQDPLTPPPAPPPPKSEPSPPPPVPQPKPEPSPPPPPPPKPVDLPKPEPAPVPLPKPDPPKPPPPKPEPPKPVAKTEPPKPNKADEDFDSLLNTLAKPKPQQRADQPPKLQKQQPQTAAASSLANAPLGSQITTSEKDMLAAAVSPCWDIDAGAKGASDMRAVIQVEVDPDGTVRNTTILDTEGRGSDPVWRAFAERARRAPLIPACNKMPIPAGKYDELKVFTFTFSPQGVL